MEEQIAVALTTAQVDWICGAITQRRTVESDPEQRARRPLRADRRRVSMTVPAHGGRNPPALAKRHASNL